MKKNRQKSEFLEQLKKVPIVLVAAEKAGLSRNTIYRWKKESEVFSKAMEEALKEGEELVNDMSESQLLSMIKDKEWSAVSFWLRHRNPKFKEKIEIEARVVNNYQLTDEQKVLVAESLSKATLPKVEKNNHEKEK